MKKKIKLISKAIMGTLFVLAFLVAVIPIAIYNSIIDKLKKNTKKIFGESFGDTFEHDEKYVLVEDRNCSVCNEKFSTLTKQFDECFRCRMI